MVFKWHRMAWEDRHLQQPRASGLRGSLLKLIYLKGAEAERDSNTHTQRREICHYLLHSPNALPAWARPGQSRKLETASPPVSSSNELLEICLPVTQDAHQWDSQIWSAVGTRSNAHHREAPGRGGYRTRCWRLSRKYLKITQHGDCHRGTTPWKPESRQSLQAV